MAKQANRAPESFGTVTRAKQKIKDSKLEKRYTDPIAANTALAACCRDVETSEVTLVKTHEDAKGADLMIIECACGKRQYRTAVGPGRVGG